jgi:hypothetical protein
MQIQMQCDKVNKYFKKTKCYTNTNARTRSLMSHVSISNVFFLLISTILYQFNYYKDISFAKLQDKTAD